MTTTTARKIIAPKGWKRGQVLHRLDAGNALAPRSYNAKERSVDAILSVGAPVKRVYGTEKLRIDAASIDLGRVRAGLAPLLDSHQGSSIHNVLGRIASTWFKPGQLWGKLVFADTEQGRIAEQMVARGEITATSLGYRVSEWEVADDEGNAVDPAQMYSGWDDDLTFTATRFEILECSLVAIPADSEALIRKLGNPDHDIVDVRARMQARQNMHERTFAMSDDNTDVFARMLARQELSDRSSDLLDENATHADRARARMKGRQKILDDYLALLDAAETADQII